MSKGLGKTQVAILVAMASRPRELPFTWSTELLEPMWFRPDLQQMVWGKHPDHMDSDSTHFTKGYGATDFRGRHYRTTSRKNVAPFNGRRRNYEQNFSRALISLKSRRLVELIGGSTQEIRLTETGRKEAERFTEDGGVLPPKDKG